MSDAMVTAIGAVASAFVGAAVKGIFDYVNRKHRQEAIEDDGKLEDVDVGGCEDFVTKDYSHYTIDGAGEFTKNRLVLEVIRQYVDKNRSVSYEELQRVFPKSLRGVKRTDSFWGCFNYQKDAERLYRETGYRRHFLGEKEVIHLANGDVIAVSTQWGSKNIKLFIACAQNLGFRINLVSP